MFYFLISLVSSDLFQQNIVWYLKWVIIGPILSFSLSAYFISKLTLQMSIKFSIAEIAFKFLGESLFSSYESCKVSVFYGLEIETLIFRYNVRVFALPSPCNSNIQSRKIMVFWEIMSRMLVDKC
jgi:hypothetical protein